MAACVGIFKDDIHLYDCYSWYKCVWNVLKSYSEREITLERDRDRRIWRTRDKEGQREKETGIGIDRQIQTDIDKQRIGVRKELKTKKKQRKVEKKGIE